MIGAPIGSAIGAVPSYTATVYIITATAGAYTLSVHISALNERIKALEAK